MSEPRSRLAILLILGALLLAGCGDSDTSQSAAPTGADRVTSLSLSEAVASPDPYARARNLGALLPELGPDALPEIQAILGDHRLDLGSAEYELLVRFWATHDPESATIWTFKRASPLFQLAAARMAISTWAAQDPAGAVGAVTMALAEANEEVARTAETALVTGWFETDRAGVESYVYDLGSGIKRQRALFAFIVALANAEGSDAAIAWAEAVPESDARYKREVFRQTMSGLAWTDMPAATRFCDRHCDGPWGRALRNILVRTRLRQGDPGGEVVEWVGATPAEEEPQIERKKDSLSVAYGTWAIRDRAQANRWMKEQLADPEHAPWLRWLYGEYARQIAIESPAEAMQWAEEMEAGKERDLTLVRIARTWLRTDPEAAEAWLAQSSLSEFQLKQARDQNIPTYLPGAPSNPRQAR